MFEDAKTCVVVFASPHKHGHTQKLLTEYLQCLPHTCKVEMVYMYELQIAPCIDCGRCATQDGCTLDLQPGDMCKTVLEKIAQADVVIVASPVYFLSLPAPIKALIDRTQQLFAPTFLAKRKTITCDKKGVLLLNCGSDDEFGFEVVNRMIRLFFRLLGVTLCDSVFVKNTDQTTK